jgi:hypothetical protein
MKQLLAWTGSADSTITSEAVMAMAEKFNTGQEVCLQIPSARGVMQVKEGTSASASPGDGLKSRGPVAVGDHPRPTVHCYTKRQSSCSAAQLNPKFRR